MYNYTMNTYLFIELFENKCYTYTLILRKQSRNFNAYMTRYIFLH